MNSVFFLNFFDSQMHDQYRISYEKTISYQELHLISSRSDHVTVSWEFLAFQQRSQSLDRETDRSTNDSQIAQCSQTDYWLISLQFFIRVVLNHVDKESKYSPNERKK